MTMTTNKRNQIQKNQRQHQSVGLSSLLSLLMSLLAVFLLMGDIPLAIQGFSIQSTETIHHGHRQIKQQTITTTTKHMSYRNTMNHNCHDYHSCNKLNAELNHNEINKNDMLTVQLTTLVDSIHKSVARSVATISIVAQILALSSSASIGLCLFPNPSMDTAAYAADDVAQSRIVGQLKGSGLFFKDTLQIESFDDPKVKGVKLYISTFQIPITERFGKNFFSDPSYASVACARMSGTKVAIADNIAKGLGGEEVFEEKKSLLFKELRVQRIYDEEANTVVYVSFNTRIDKSDDTNKSRFKSSLCAVNLD